MSEKSRLTKSESDFVHHFFYEVIAGMHSKDPKPTNAISWLVDHGISTTLMQVFQYAEQESNPEWFYRVDEESMPSFQAPWSSKAEFESRVRELLEIFPKMKSIGSACPRGESLT